MLAEIETRCRRSGRTRSCLFSAPPAKTLCASQKSCSGVSPAPRRADQIARPRRKRRSGDKRLSRRAPRKERGGGEGRRCGAGKKSVGKQGDETMWMSRRRASSRIARVLPLPG
ncbi:hypothetical protein BC937DRAFT_93653 [Endogone sp. FLAS-F59071]|nr:hypothetical protein BC937DRAFT_93653 [Endogone sp. FLAS-F59071]|eukprot:RUS14546.1 hypothetical protein BC937DRAFT_93653 [Endogone sp. FLAS-F59071]